MRYFVNNATEDDVLRKDVLELAERSYNASLSGEIQALELRCRQAQVSFAAKGINGGHAVPELVSYGVDYVRTRCRSATASLMDSCKSHGLRPKLRDLRDAWERLVPMQDGRAGGIVIGALRPHANQKAAADRVAGALAQARLQGRADAMVDLEHFVAQNGRDRRLKAWGIIERVLWAIFGALLDKGYTGLAALLHWGK